MPGRWRVCVCVCARGGGRSPFCNVLANSSAACLVLTSTTQVVCSAGRGARGRDSASGALYQLMMRL
jgi:hypothetical protein